MLDIAKYRELISGKRRGLVACAQRALLRVASWPYGWAVRWRNRRFDRKSALVHAVHVPVICVGNITTGGTGKTPLVLWLARWFRARQVRVSIVSRGYGAEQGAVNDEALELEELLPDVPHLQSPDRVNVARIAVEELDTQLILMDDGFQHRRLHRDANIVLLDALQPFGYGSLLPRGMLREPLAGLARARCIVLTRADLVPAERRAEIKQRALSYAPQANWAEVRHAPQLLRAADGSSEPLDLLAGKNVVAFCGLGNPAGFRQTIEQAGFKLAKFREFPDHHAYTRQDVEDLRRWVAAIPDIQAVLCSHKDLVKLGIRSLGSYSLWALQIGIEFLTGESELTAMLEAFLPQDAEAS